MNPTEIPDINTIFRDLDEYRDFCRTYGRVFNERHLYKENSPYNDFLIWKKTGRAVWWPGHKRKNRRS